MGKRTYQRHAQMEVGQHEYYNHDNLYLDQGQQYHSAKRMWRNDLYLSRKSSLLN